MQEKDCTKLALRHVETLYPPEDTASWSSEFADRDGLRPDGLLVARNGFFRSLFTGKYCVHAIESKVDPRYFAGMTARCQPEALEQLLVYHANARWLAVANAALYDDQWELLESHCRAAGVGLICCKARTFDVLATPTTSGGAFWQEYPVLRTEMARIGWSP